MNAPTLTGTDRRTLRWPASAAVRARELRDAGWSVKQIAAIMEREYGHRPAMPTILRWTDPEGARRRDTATRARLRAQRAAAGGYSFALSGPSSPERREAFIHRLRAEGVPRETIARVCRVVFDDPTVTNTDVRRALGEHPR